MGHNFIYAIPIPAPRSKPMMKIIMPKTHCVAREASFLSSGICPWSMDSPHFGHLNQFGISHLLKVQSKSQAMSPCKSKVSEEASILIITMDKSRRNRCFLGEIRFLSSGTCPSSTISPHLGHLNDIATSHLLGEIEELRH